LVNSGEMPLRDLGLTVWRDIQNFIRGGIGIRGNKRLRQ